MVETVVVPEIDSLARPSVEEKLLALEGLLAGLGSALVCFSGGVDSAFVLAAAQRTLGARAVGMTAVSASVAPAELEDAVRVARQIGADHRLVHTSEMLDPNYQKNGPDRCFFCKSELYRVAEDRRAAWGLSAVLNGTNTDDLGDYRPGLEAAKNAGVVSPLVELGFNKADVREGARLFGLSVWDKPAAACLSSRIPFGTRVSEDRLAQIASFEAALRALGFRRVRVRYHPISDEGSRAFARIELDSAEITRAASEEVRSAIVEAGKRSGFLYVTLDLMGYRLGSHNEALSSDVGGAKPRSLPIVE